MAKAHGAAADVLRDVEAELGERFHLTNLAIGIPVPELGYEDVAGPMKLTGGQVAIEIPAGNEPDYYRIGPGETLEVAIYIHAEAEYLIRPAAPSMLVEDINRSRLWPVHIDETPFAEEDSSGADPGGSVDESREPGRLEAETDD